ncbi:DNA polymerase III subunit gamma/tau [Prauserella marina]|uniref:DNA polymerase III subunit gamma/tau n=1 Tax=Prauserella marina TaxID=530584 RepID=A0A222W0Q0_9PSEU|nr:DNA polymerase III subunit gamma and tau [Prauserella marina]ASR39786.1 DNA polymerase III subunit gamma/tau [Prauserella marina]PWV78312.1 DNA polymerase III tau subunit [Prauserella marina]SDC83181.1 DNA polymerase-3 subunit gamma/tau [Prauserella marina]
MALALYRKYRPATFAEVVGQEHVTEPLRTALSAGRINHAYLFSGPRGCGKTSSARIMARSLNCVEGPTPDPCGVCGPCKALAPEGPGSVDVTELDAASHGGVDDARELRDRAFYAPAESRYRVFIIDEAHMVTTQGFNALLKIVEEPPEHLIFIFATTEPDKVLTTIRSRTHHYPFRLIPPSAMRELLERNVAAEGVEVEPAVFPLVIRAGGGSARDTQSVLDQLLAGAGEQGVTYDRAVSLLGVTDSALIDAMVDALATDDSKNVYGTVDHLAEAGHDPRRFASDLLDRLRDLILLRSVPDAATTGMVSAPEEQLGRMVAQAERIKPGTLSRYAEIIHNGLLEMRGATAPRLLLELLCARMLLPEVSDDEAGMLQRLERLERRVTAGVQPTAGDQAAAAPPVQSAPTAPAAQSAPAGSATPAGQRFQRPSQRAGEPAPARQPEQSPAPEPVEQAASEQAPAERKAPAAAPPRVEQAPPARAEEQAAAPGQIDAAALRQYWPQLLAEVRKLSRSTEAMLTNATVHSVEGSTVVLTHTAEPLARRLAEPRNADCIATALGNVVSGTWSVRCVHAGAVGAQEAPRARQQQRPSGPAASPQAERTYQRPSAGEQPRKPVVATTEPDIPLPPEPEDEEHYADATDGVSSAAPSAAHGAGPDSGTGPASEGSASREPAEPADPEEAAHKLLSDHLGARPINER